MASTRNIRGISIEIGGDTTRLENSLKTVYQRSNDLTKELRSVDRALKFNPKSVELTSQKQKILTEQVDNTRKRLNELKSAQAEVTRQYEAGEIDAGQYRAFQRELIETESILKTYEGQLSEVTDKYKVFGKSMEDLGGKLQGIGGKLKDAGKNLTTKLTVPIMGVATAAGKMALDLETSIKKVSTLADSDILPVSKIEQEVRAISDASGIAQTEIAESVYAALSAGVDSADVMEFVRSGIDLTRAGFTDMETAIDATTTVLNAYGDDAYDVSKIHDIFVQTQDKGKISVDELGKSLGRVVPTASSLGVNMDELGASYAILTAKGQNAQLATTNLNSMLAEMGKSGSKTDETLRELTGKGFAELIDEGYSVGEVLEIIDNHAKENDLSLKDMFGSMTAGSAAVTLLSDGVEGYNESLQNMHDAEGKTQENAEKTTDGWRKIQEATTQLKNALMDLGGYLAPTIEKFAEKVSVLTEKFSSLSPETQENIVKIGLMVAAIGPAIMIMGSLTDSTGTLIEAGGKLVQNWDKIKGVGSLLAGGLKGTVGFIFSPAGAIMLGIAAVIAGGVLLWKNWDKVKEFGANLKNSLTESWITLGANTAKAWNNIKDGIMNPINKAKDAVKTAIDKMKGFFNFNWKLPSIKMPKFSVSGSANPLDWLKEGVPKLSVSWHARGGILTRPGIFGMMGNTLLAGGEHRTGGEAILPLNRLPQIMADAMEMANRTQRQPKAETVQRNNERPEVNVYQEIHSPKELDARESQRLARINMQQLAYQFQGI